MELANIEDIEVISNPRKNFSSVPDLAKSIDAVGLLQPLAVRLKPDDKKRRFILVDGERRLRALKELKIDQVPIHVVGITDEQGHKEAQMIANLERSDLSLIEKMRGYADLLENAPAKYNEKVIANKFGLKEKQVKTMVSLARKIDPACDAALSSGSFDAADFDYLAFVPKEYQGEVIQKALKLNNMRQAMHSLTADLHFSNVFTLEQAKASGKIHYEPWEGNYRTFDKEFAAKVKADFEAQEKKNYEKEKSKAQKESQKQIELTAEQKKKKREKKAADIKRVLDGMRETFPKFLVKKSDEKQIDKFISFSMKSIAKDDLKGLMKSFELEYDSEMDPDKMRASITKNVLGPILKDSSELEKLRLALNLYEFTNFNHQGFFQVSDPSSFTRLTATMKKILEKK